MTTDKGLADRLEKLVVLDEVRSPNTLGKDAAARIRELEAEVERRVYTYIGKDGKPVLARDLEDQRDAAEARCRKLEDALRPFAEVAAHDIGTDEADDDLFQPVSERNARAPRLRVGHLRDARALLDQADGEGRAADGIAVDVICGGFPCQPFSTASRGRRVAVDLWPEMHRIICELRPRYAVAENVQEAAITRAAAALRTLGYGTNHRCISADDAGADHQRNRWWVVTHPHNEGEFSRLLNAEVARLPKLCRGLWGPANYARAVRVPDGLPDRVHRLRGLGNAVVPQIPELIGRAILAAEAERRAA